MTKRIIPVSSGKGGVGKTCFAINLALCLSRFGKTVLIDLDTGTSSVRNVIQTPIQADLYHFFKKRYSLNQCITSLPSSLNPHGHFDQFGFIASPLHMIEAITNMSQATRNTLIDRINGLDAEYIILDLKAGLDSGVLDFIPLSNTGILVFTPNHPAATSAAADIAKAVLFRKIREVFHAGSLVYKSFKWPNINAEIINKMINRTEDSYDQNLPNLDAFLFALNRSIPNHPMVRLLANMIEFFRVYYVLNRFDGVDASYETAVKPFVEMIGKNVSARVNINNLGWIAESQNYHRTNMEGIPFVLKQANREKNTKRAVRVTTQLEELYEITGLKREKPSAQITKSIKQNTQNVLDDQLKAIEGLFRVKASETLKQNFDYIISSIRYLFENKRVSAFGDTRILKKGELVPLILNRKN